MTNVIFTNTSLSGRSSLSCVWVKTGNPKQPLACVWIDNQVRIAQQEAAGVPAAHFTKHRLCA